MVWEERIWYLKERPTYNNKVNHSYLEPKMLRCVHGIVTYRPQARSRLPGLGSLVTRAPPMQDSQEKTFSRLFMGGTRVYPTLLSFLSGTVGHPNWDPRSPHARLQPPL